MPFSGQLWYLTEGGDAETRLVRINDDGTSSTIVNDNGGGGTGDDDFISSFTADVGVDTASGFYFAIANAPAPQNDTAYLVRGVIGGGSAPVIVANFDDSLIVNTIEVDAINHRIYVGLQDGTGADGAVSGIKVYTYNPSTGAITDNGYITTANSDNRADAGGAKILDPFDFAIDYSTNQMFYTEAVDGLTSGLFRLDLASPNTAINILNNTQFPVDLSNGQMMDVAVDTTTDLVYFTTRSRSPSPNGAYDANDNALWYISENASAGSTATKVTLTGLPANVYYGGDMAFDQGTRQIYLESSEASPGAADNVIYVFQLNGAGTSASLIRTINPGLTLNGAVTEGMTFVDVAALDVAGTGASPTEQSAGTTTLLTGAPTITDGDGGYLVGATVQITSGGFNTTDDHIGFSASKIVSGTVPGTTNITISWNAATSTLTLSGYDTFANYQTALAGLVYWSTGDNPTNYGANTSRTLTWTINDGTPGILAASPNGATVNIDTTTINIAAVNDAPVNGTVSSATGNENTNIAITGLQVSDVDADPASAVVTVTLSVTKGVLTLRTNVASGLVSGDIVGNGTATVTVTATINKINLTLAASNGLVFLGDNNVSGTDTLTVVTNDGGATGSPGAQSDTDGYTITIIGLNDAPTVSGDGTETLAATNEDVANVALTNTVSGLFSGQYTDPDTDAFAGVAVVANGSSAGTGQWQYYNGSTWVNIGAASTAAAVTLAAATPLRFLPATDFNGPAPTLTVRVVDASGGALTNGAVVNTTTNGGSTAYSTGTVVLSHGVTAVNDAPTVTGGSTVSLASIGEDSAPGAGETVSSLFASHFSDAKDEVSGGSSANTLAGVAITANAATAGQGVYQYFDGTWQDLPAVSASSAFVLDASTLVRFAPAADYSGTAPALTVSMIDNASGAVTTGATLDLTTTGGSTSYSAALSLSIVVTATNDAPVASGSAALAAVNEDTAAPSGASVSSLFTSNFNDIDGNALAGVAITANAASTQGVWQYFNGAWTTIGSPSESSALVLAAGTLVRFLPAANFEGSVPALTAYLIDNSGGAVTTGTLLDVSVNGGQTRFSDASVSLSTSITAVNDAPVVPASATTVGATEQTAAVLLGSLTVSDLELDARNGGIGDYAGAIFTVQRASANAADTFSFGGGSGFTISGANLQVGGLTFATFTSTGGVLTVTFTSSGDSATTALVNDVIHNIRYTNTSDAPPDSVTLNYSLNDGGGQGTGGALASGGSVVVNITAVNDVHTGGASITGTAVEDQVLTAVSTLVDPDGLGTLHYQWQRDVGGGYVNVGADQATYTLVDGDIGGVVRVVIYYTDAGGTVESATSAATAAISAGNDPHTGGASITGTATEDQVLTAVSTLVDADGLGTLHYQWQHDVGAGFVNVGADQSTYTLGDSDVGGVVRVVISYTDGQGFAESATSASTAAIANINDPHTGGVSVTGAANVGQVLTADASTLADIDGLGTLHYQWQSDTGSGFVNIGTDQSTYTLTGAELGGVIRVVTTYTDGRGTAEAATSAATSTVLPANGPHTGTVTITGTVTEDQVLTADTSTLADPAGLGAFSYQWQRDTGSGFLNVGTNLATYALGDADVGATIRVIVSFTDGQGVVETATSGATAAVANVNDLPTGAVTITGTVAEDQVLTADTSTLADADGLGTLHYQWQRDAGGGFVNVGTDLSTYTLGDADVGATIRVVASYTDLRGTAESKTSTATAAVANVNDGPTAANDAKAVTQRLTSAVDSVRTNDGDIDNVLTTLTVTNVAYNATHVDQLVLAGGTVVNGAYGKLTINPDGTYTYTADGEGLVVGQVVTDTFDYTIEDPSGAAATAQLTVTVTGSATGDANANILISNASGHTLTGKGGADTLTGADGADVFDYEAVSDSTIAAFDTITDFTHAVDTLRLTPLITGSTKLTVNIDGTGRTLLIDQNGDGTAEGQIRLLGQGLEVSDIVTGAANFGFTINGSAAGEFLTGGSGVDAINGSDGADTIRGNGGGDILTGGAGLDTFIYDDGDASILHWDVITDFQTGQDKLNIAAADDGVVILARFGASTFIYFGGLGNSSVVQVFGDIRTSDLITSSGVTFSMYGDDGTSGGSTSDTLTGGDQDDVLVGGTTDSTLTGGDGADIMYGGAARDTFRYESVSNSNFSAYDSVIDFTPDQDKIDISAIDGGKVTIARFAGTTFIYSAPDAGGNFQSVITVSGTALKATDVIASGGPTQSFVMVGDSTSSNVADALIAGAGNDILYGLDGDDVLTGAGGADFILGGAGADTFIYTAATDSSPFAQDLIFDFASAQGDKVDLTGIDANAATGANDAFSVVSAFSNVAGQLVIAAPDASGYHHVSGDVNGDGVADFVIALSVTGTLAASDILL